MASRDSPGLPPVNIPRARDVNVAESITFINPTDQSQRTSRDRWLRENELEYTPDGLDVNGHQRCYIQTRIGILQWLGDNGDVFMADNLTMVSYHLNAGAIQTLMQGNCSAESAHEVLGKCLASLEWSPETVFEHKFTQLKLTVAEEKMPRLLQTVINLISDCSDRRKLVCLVKQAFAECCAQLKAIKLSSLVFVFQHTDAAKADEMLGSEEMQGKLIGILYQFLPEWVRLYARWEMMAAKCDPTFICSAEPVVRWLMPHPDSVLNSDSQRKEAIDAEWLAHQLEPVIKQTIERFVDKVLAPLQSSADLIEMAMKTKGITEVEHQSSKEDQAVDFDMRQKSKPFQMQASPKHQPTEDIDRTVQVSGGDVAMNEEVMQLYFENTRLSGGGPIFRTEVKEDAKVTLITFEEQTAADRVLNRSHKVSSTKLSVTPYKPKDAAACTKIRVKGLTSKVSEEMLQLYFENRGRTDVVEVYMFAHKGEAVVEFDNPAAVQTVLALSHKIGGKSVMVTPEITHKAIPASPATSKTSSTPAGGTQGHPMPTPQTYTVEVQGLVPVTTKDTVMLYFENKRRSGGGVIDDLQYVEGSGVASVTFRDAEAMTRVLQQQHRIDNKILRVSRASPQQSSRSAGSAGTAAVSASTGLTTVSVRGLPPSTSTDALMCYFENKRSGGGDVKEIHLDKRSGVFFVTFEEQEVAARVAARSHIFQNQTMDVRLEEPPQPYTDRILLTNLPAVRTTDELKYFVEAKTQVSVSSILFGDSGDVAVIMFESHIDHKEVQAALTRKPFKGHALSVDSIPQSCTILVKNLPKHPPVSKELLMFYFENPRKSGGGEVTNVEIDREGQYALVTFADPEVAVRVSAAARELKLHSSVLAVSLYLECLGVSGGSTELTASLPPQRPLSESHYQKISHLHNLPGAMQDLQDSLANRHARLEFGAGCGFVVCTLTQEVDNVRQLARSWEDDVDRILDIHLQPIFIHQLEVTPEVFTHAEGRAKQKVTGDSGVNLSYDAGKELLTVVYKGQQKRDIFEEIVDIVTTVQSEVNMKKPEQAEYIRLSKEKLQLLKTHKTVHDAKEKYPKLKIIFNDDNKYLELKGAKEEIQDVKLRIYTALHSIVSLQYTWPSDLHKQLLELPVARMTVESLCIERGPDEVVEFTPDGFQVHSFDTERAEMVQTIAIQAVQKRVIRFDENSRHATKCQEWSELKCSVVINSEELVVMDETTEALTLVGIGPSVHKEYKRLLDFLEKNGVKQQALQLPRALHELFRPYFLDRVLDMSLKQDDFVFDPDNDQIIISGDRLCLDTAEGILHTFKQEITMKKVTYTEPSVEEFLQMPAWQRKRKDMAINDKCLVLDPEELPGMYQEETGVKEKEDPSFPLSSSDRDAKASGGISMEQAQSASTSSLSLDVKEARRHMKVGKPASPTQAFQRYPFFENTRGRVAKIYVGLNKTAVDKADNELLQCYKESVVTVSEDKLNLSQWDELSKNNLINACRIAKVDITLNFDLGRLTLHGFLEKVDKIPKHSIIKEAEKGVKELKHAELISQQVQWSSIEVGKGGTLLLPYDKRNNYRIEMDYQEGKPRSMIDEFVGGVRLTYTIDFTTMEEIPEDPEEAAKPRPTVIRQNKIRGVEVQPPKTWSSMQGMVDVVPLSPSSPEYQGVAKTFMQSLQRPATKIQRIERIQNLTLYKQYQTLKQKMETSMPPKQTCELTKLWHGAKSEAVDGIIRYGFNRSFSTLQKCAYGQGSYFTTTAAYSSRDEYAKADLSQQRHMFRCSVLVGEYTKGDQSMRSPPEKTPGGKRYNSTVDDVNSPTIFVTYSDMQAYPEYRIVFKDQ
ncbi:uncharacterized protein LOC143293736 [Babylonia areolata]|uniref:uncharacterized protein LOC143293736 n=1 Tax=Babylonia areolata TaxID=304850 RepID=UPI003FD60657